MRGDPTIEINGLEYEKREKYYFYSKKGPLNTMKIGYGVQGGYGWCKCGIKVGYIDGTTKDRYICEYNDDEDIWAAETEIKMSDVLIVLVAIQEEHDYLYDWDIAKKFTQRFEKELSLYKRSLSDPDSLKNLCRQVVRQRMGERIRLVYLLGVPPSIERYILCTRGRWCNGGCEYCKK
jgi:hypothetical protein